MKKVKNLEYFWNQQKLNSPFNFFTQVQFQFINSNEIKELDRILFTDATLDYELQFIKSFNPLKKYTSDEIIEEQCSYSFLELQKNLK